MKTCDNLEVKVASNSKEFKCQMPSFKTPLGVSIICVSMPVHTASPSNKAQHDPMRSNVTGVVMIYVA